MYYLNTGQALQAAYMTLQEGRDNLPSSFSDYLMLMKSMNDGSEFYQVLTVEAENSKWTKVLIDTTEITMAGDYAVTIWGQNSGSNLDPNDESVVGIVDSCIINLTDSTTFVTPANITIPANVTR